MYSVIGGIRPMAPGFKKILFAPEPGGGLTEATTSLQTPHGLASCQWRLRGRRLSVDLKVPEGVHAGLRLPGRNPRTLKPGHFSQTTTLPKFKSSR
jgi:alpha-L-rhamnosidase